MLTACGSNEDFAIEARDWEFSVAVSSEDGSAQYCADHSLYPDAQVIDLDCEITEDAIVLSTDSESWVLPYTLENLGVTTSLYQVGEDGEAAVTLTTYDDGTSVYTLVISCGGYGLYFYES